jgi:hypothetical protein
MRFLTPTCIRRNNRTSPLLAPDSLARGLTERWRHLHPATAPPLPGPGPGPVWISDLDGHSEVQVLTRRIKRDGQWHLRDEIISGYTGRIRFVCETGTDNQAAAFDALLAFAAYAGAGSHTTYGFGVTTAEDTWQSPTQRIHHPPPGLPGAPA